MKSHTVIGHQVRAVTIPCHLHPPGVAPGLSPPFQGRAAAHLAPTTQPVLTPCDPLGKWGTKRGEPSFPGQVVISGMRLEFNSPVPNPWNSSSQPGPLPWPIQSMSRHSSCCLCKCPNPAESSRAPRAFLGVFLARERLILVPATSPSDGVMRVRVLLGSCAEGRPREHRKSQGQGSGGAAAPAGAITQQNKSHSSHQLEIKEGLGTLCSCLSPPPGPCCGCDTSPARGSLGCCTGTEGKQGINSQTAPRMFSEGSAGSDF